MGAETLLLVGAGVAAGANVIQGYQQRQAMKWQALQQEADADAERGMSALRADKIRKAAERQRGQAVAAQAAAGVRVGEGSAADAEAYVTRTGEQDALSELISGSYRSSRLRADAEISRMSGSNAMMGGLLTGGATLLEGYGRYKYLKGAPGSSGYRISKSANASYYGSPFGTSYG